MVSRTLDNLLTEIRQCRQCEPELALGARPVLSVSESAKILVIGQAPGTRVHASGIPWNDPSGDRLRSWMAVDRETFYDSTRIAIMPMGFCYPKKEKVAIFPHVKSVLPCGTSVCSRICHTWSSRCL